MIRRCILSTSIATAGIVFALAFSMVEARRAASPRTRVQEGGRQGRLAPPATLRCPRDNITSFTGRVLAYQRSSGRVFIRVRTDEDTTESFTLRFPKTDDASKLFLLNGGPFGQKDWSAVERRKGFLRPRMRATVWACYVNNEPRAELIDWRPREIETNSVY